MWYLHVFSSQHRRRLRGLLESRPDETDRDAAGGGQARSRARGRGGRQEQEQEEEEEEEEEEAEICEEENAAVKG